MFILLLACYFALFFILCVKNLRLAVGVFIISLPSYLIRFNLGPLPTTLLELEFGILFLVWLVKFARFDLSRIAFRVARNNFLFYCFLVFFLSSIVSIFISDMWFASLGEWRAYILEPMMLFVVLAGRLRPGSAETHGTHLQNDNEDGGELTPSDLAWFLVLSAVSVSVLAIIQKLTGQLYPPSLWDDQLGGRATSFFTSPNAVGLSLGPCYLLSLSLMLNCWQTNKRLLAVCLLAIIGLGLLASGSVGAIAAVVVALLIFAVCYGKKQIVRTAFVGGIIFLITAAIIPQSRNLLSAKLRSGNNRLVLWQYSEEFLTKNPKNFIFGAGIRQFFRKVQKPHYNVKEMERLIYPHNWFLNFWLETGLLGVLSISLFCATLLCRLYKKIRYDKNFLAVGIFCAFIATIVHGMIDVPYFKNDLAMLFWVLAAIALACVPDSSSPKRGLE